MFNLTALLALPTVLLAPAVPRGPSPRPVDIRAAAALVARVLPGRSASFAIEGLPFEQGRDVFEVESRNGRIVLRGSTGVAVASALNWYLEHVVRTNVAIPLRPITLPASLPVVPARVRITTP